MAKNPTAANSVETLTHDEAKRLNIPTAEYQSVLEKGHCQTKFYTACSRTAVG